MSRTSHVAVSAAVLAGTLILAGCAGSTSDAVATPEPITSESVHPVTDAETCAAVGDVLSITFNADLAVRQDRMSSQEQAGWYRLATRVLDRVPTRGEGSVSEGVSALQVAAPPIALTAIGASQIGSDKWASALTALLASCADAGSEIATTSFTGG